MVGWAVAGRVGDGMRTQGSLESPRDICPFPPAQPSLCSLGNWSSWRCRPSICDVQLLLRSDRKDSFLGQESSARLHDTCAAPWAL